MRRRSSQALAWAQQVIAAHGQAQPDGTVLVPLTQAELSRVSGRARNNGSVAYYLRSLGPAVLRRRGGLVLDPSRLGASDLPLTHDPASTAAPSNAGQRRRCHRVASSPGPERRRSDVDAATMPSHPLAGELVDVARQLLLMAEQLDPSEAAQLIRRGPRGPRDVRDDIAESQDRQTEGSAIENEKTCLPVSSPSGPVANFADFAECAVEAGEPAAALVDEPRDAVGARDWEDADLVEMLEPIRVAARSAGRASEPRWLPGVRHALAPYELARVRHAVAVVAAQLQATPAKVRSPYGLLADAAQRGDPAYFPTEVPQPHAPKPLPVVREPSGDEEAAAEVAALRADPRRAEELAELQASLRAALQEGPGLSPEFVFGREAVLEGYLQSHWRQLHPRAEQGAGRVLS